MLTSFQVNGVELNAPNPGVTGLWLEYPIQGLEAPSYRVSSWDKAGQDGAGLTNPFYGVRTVTLTGKIQRLNETTYENARQTVLAAFGISRDSNGNIVKQTYQFTTAAGQTYFFSGQAKTPVFGIEQMGWTKWKVDILVGDPYIYLSGLQTTGQFQPPQGGGFNVPTNVQTVSTLTGTQSVAAINTGNITTPATIILRGSLTTPYLVNSTVGLSMKINYTLGIGDTVIIDMLNKTIMLNGTTSLLGDKDSTSNWWGIQPGTNLISLSSGSTSDTGTAEVEWYNAVSGV